MSSIIPGYEYDIFISYRQKDNKGDRWVTEFVDNLKRELEATFKEDVSVYFDINPHDGLLETHEVGASLEDKLKCLIFIPVISQTYCDPKSFAWQYEFCAFNKLAKEDQFGRNIKLPGGNVASRILPVRIHDLDPEDKTLLEYEIGGVLRGIEFIYKSAGVNRPLREIEDHPQDNLNKTYYRDQVNKVANAIKEIISGMKTGKDVSGKEQPDYILPWEEAKKGKRIIPEEKSARLSKSRLISYVIAAVFLLVVAGLYFYPKIFRQDILEKLWSSGKRISIAVMPFQNMTNDTIWNVWQNGIQDALIFSLSNSDELIVQNSRTIDYFIRSKGITNYSSFSPLVASTVSQKLEANIFIYGSINKAGSTIRLNAQLINSETAEVYKTFQIEGPSDEEMIFHIMDSLSFSVKNFLIVSKMKKEGVYKSSSLGFTNSSEAYKYYIYGNNAFFKDFGSTAAMNWYLKALEIDSNFTAPAVMLTGLYANLGLLNKGKELCLKFYEKRDQMPEQQKLNISSSYAFFFETTYEQVKYLRQLLEIDNQDVFPLTVLGWRLIDGLYQYDKGIQELEKVLEIYNKRGLKPETVVLYTRLGFAYHKTGQYKKEKKLYKKAEKDFPNNFTLIINQAILSLTEGDTISANAYLEKIFSLSTDNSEFNILQPTILSYIYEGAGLLDKAEKYYRDLLLLQPNNIRAMNRLGYYLIDKERNVDEGLKLVNKALENSNDSYNLLHSKGWGLYKQGKYKEALEVLQKSWDLRREKAVYDHEAFLHLEEAKKAVAR